VSSNIPLVGQSVGSDFIDDYFLGLIKQDPTLSEFQYDLGLGLISKSLDFKIGTTLAEIQKEVRELFYPQLETTLLAHLLYKVGYIRFKKPLEVYADVVSTQSTWLARNTRFSDGIDVYYLPYSVYLPANVTTKISLSLQDIHSFDVQVSDATLFFKIKTNVNYKQLVGANVFKDNNLLEYSQNFVSMTSEVSYEIKQDGLIEVCILLNNNRANRISQGDTLKVEIITSSDTQQTPEALNIIESGYDYVQPCSNVALKSNYKAPMTLDEMKDMITYGRKNLGDICLNEDYLQFIHGNFPEIMQLKVWQEKEEEEEVGAIMSHINKVFLAYVKWDGTTGDRDLDSRITSYVQEKIYGKEIWIRDAKIYPLDAIIEIETDDVYDASLRQTIQNEIAGYYDDIHNKINKDVVYSKTFEILRENLRQFTLTTSVSDKGVYENRKFYTIVPADVDVIFSPMP